MERYASYKDSGVEWIGEIPEHWSVQRLKSLVTKPLQYGANESGIPFDETLPRYIRITDVALDGSLKSSGMLSLTEKMADGYILNDGDILFARSGATVGKAFYYKTEYGRSAFAGYMIRATINHRKVLPCLVYYSTMAENYEDWKSMSMTQATIQNIGANKYNDFSVVIPAISEQSAIAAYLDDKVGQIDTIIAEAKASIDEYKQWKASIIYEAVTKGLDPNAEMKDSGVPYIGLVPETTTLLALKNLVDISDGTHDTPAYVDATEYSFPLVTSRCIVNGKIDLSIANHISENDYKAIIQRSYVNKFDVIMPMIGTVGNPALVETDEKFATKNVAIFRTNGSYVLGKYVKYILDSSVVITQFELTQRGGVQNFVSQDKLKNLVIPLPHNIENIVMYLDYKTSIIGSLISEKESLIADLESYKKSLIYEVVTGKRKVV